MAVRTLMMSTLLGAALVLSGCGGGGDESAGLDIDVSDGSTTVTGEDGSVTVDSDGESLTITGSDEGEEYSVTTGGAAEIPASFPSDVPLPDGAKLLSAVEESQGSTSLTWEWPGLNQEILDAYLASVKDAGYTLEGQTYSMDMGGGDFTSGGQFTGPTHTVAIVGLSADGMGQLSITSIPVE